MNNKLSRNAFIQAKKNIPGGVNSPVRAFNHIGIPPPFIRKGSGSLIMDLDSNSYIDFCGSWGALIHGHANPDVANAAKKAIDLGSSFGCPTLAETNLAESILDSYPSMDLVRFVNSGTEAVMSALRLARAYTQRNKIVKFDGCYHGHADYLLVAAGSGLATNTLAASNGVPENIIENTISIPYNNLDLLEKVFRDNSRDIAAVIIEPVAANMGVIHPGEGFLKALSALCQQNSTLLIFDEVITGFRLAEGGAQEIYSINPDLTILGKIIGGGFPVGAYSGKKSIMSMLSPDGDVYQAGTLSGNPIAMAAGSKAIELLRKNRFYEDLNAKARFFESEVLSGINNFPVRFSRAGSMFTLFFTDGNITNFEDVNNSDHDRFRIFYRYALEHGIYLSPSPYETNFISSSHSKKDLKQAGSVIRQALKESFS